MSTKKSPTSHLVNRLPNNLRSSKIAVEPISESAQRETAANTRKTASQIFKPHAAVEKLFKACELSYWEMLKSMVGVKRGKVVCDRPDLDLPQFGAKASESFLIATTAMGKTTARRPSIIKRHEAEIARQEDGSARKGGKAS
jgi:hypothetical protein